METTIQAVTAPDFSPLISALTGSITPAVLITILASCVVVGFAYVVMWFGVRKIASSFTAAVFRGNIRI